MTGLSCLQASGFVAGMCSQSCSGLCPDQPGKTMTFCVVLAGDGHCVSRCNTTLHPSGGCREGYRCAKLPRHGQSSIRRNVCVPEVGPFSLGSSAAAPDVEGDLPDQGAVIEGGCALGGTPAAHDLALVALLLLGASTRARLRRAQRR